MSRELPIEISRHAREQMAERGANDFEVQLAIRKGEPEPVRNKRTLYRKNFQFDSMWRGRQYRIKQVAPIVKDAGDKFVVITVYVFYF